MASEEVPGEVLRAYGFERAGVTLEPVSIGLINRTLRVLVGGAPAYVLQRLHPVFGAAVNEDIDAITAHLEARGMRTPRVHRTLAGALWHAHDGAVWRALTHVHGVSTARLADERAARSAGALVGRFHRAVDGFEYEFRHVRPAAHDTPRHLAKLRDTLARFGAGTDEERAVHAVVGPLAEQILAHAAVLPSVPVTKKRIVHGDLKVSNLLLSEDGSEGLALVDLDTLAHGTAATELGDALRSWCNPADEDEPRPEFSRALFEASLAGYAEGAPGLLDASERASVAPGTETIATELASRFCNDALEDRYFGWNPARFASRREHNIARARGQLALAKSVARQRAELNAIVQKVWG